MSQTIEQTSLSHKEANLSFLEDRILNPRQQIVKGMIEKKLENYLLDKEARHNKNKNTIATKFRPTAFDITTNGDRGKLVLF